MTGTIPPGARAPGPLTIGERWLAGLLRSESASSLVLAVGLNLAFLAVAGFAGIERPLVNVDFVFAGAVLHKGRWGRLAACVLVFLGLVYEIYRYVAGVYLFDLGQIFDTLGYVYAWPLGAVARAVAVIVAGGLTLILFGRYLRRYRFPSTALLAFGSLAFVADAAHGGIRFSRLQGHELTQGDTHFAYSSLGETLTLVSNYFNGPKKAGPRLTQVRSYQTALAFKGKGDVLVITDESLGVFRDPSEQAAFQEAVRQALGTREVQFGAETSNGVTIDGELRVLCKTGFGSVDASITNARPYCLPELFDQAGYVTSAAHAYFGDFYKRTERYPRLGFEHTRFLHDGVDRRCTGAFESGCDDDALRNLLATPAAPGQHRFLYQMTIETHLPEPACGAVTDPIAGYKCRHLAFFRKLGAQLAGIDRPTRVVIAGDHPPPFPRADTRGQFVPHAVTVITLDAGPKPAAPKLTGQRSR